MRRVLGALCAVFFAASVSVTPVFAAATNQSIAVPMYEFPGSQLWTDVNNAGSDVPWIIANPANGPGVSVDPFYTTALNTSTAAGNRVLGYIDTNYQARPIADPIKDADDWYTMYPQVSGIFIDRIDDANAAQICYQAALYNYIRAKHPDDLIVANPGTHIIDALEPYGDIFMTFEGSYTDYQAWTMPVSGFESQQSNQNRQMHLIYDVPVGNYPAVLTQTRNFNIGWVFITDRDLPNPYDGNVAYWNSLLADVGTLPASTIPNRGPSDLPAGCVDLDASADTNPGTVANEQSTLDAEFTVENGASAQQIAYAGTKVVFQLPTGVTLGSSTGSNWSCGGNTCTYNSDIAPGDQANVLGVAVNTSCEYSGGTVSYELQGNNQQAYANGSLTPAGRPACEGQLANTGDNTTMITLIAAGMIALSGIVLIRKNVRR